MGTCVNCGPISVCTMDVGGDLIEGSIVKSWLDLPARIADRVANPPTYYPEGGRRRAVLRGGKDRLRNVDSSILACNAGHVLLLPLGRPCPVGTGANGRS